MNYNHCSHDLQRCMWFFPYWYKQTDLPFVCYIILNTWVFSFFVQCFIQTCTQQSRDSILQGSITVDLHIIIFRLKCCVISGRFLNPLRSISNNTFRASKCILGLYKFLDRFLPLKWIAISDPLTTQDKISTVNEVPIKQIEWKNWTITYTMVHVIILSGILIKTVCLYQLRLLIQHFPGPIT